MRCCETSVSSVLLRTNVEISEYFLGPLDPGDGRHHEVEADQARAAGLDIVQCRDERLQLEFFDVGAMVSSCARSCGQCRTSPSSATAPD